MDLGILMSDDLQVSRQCLSSAGRANRALGSMRMAFKHIDSRTLVVLYKAFVRPLLEYSSAAWSPHLKKDIRALENVQRRMTRLLPTLRSLSYRDRLSSLYLSSLETRR